MNTLLIVDGSNLLFQMFYGMPARIVNKDGKAIQGTLGFVGALLKMLRKIQPDEAVVLFDGESYNARTELDSAYKANRPDYSQMAEEETPFSQLPDIYAALDYLKIPHTETTVCETDDVVAAYALRYGQERKIVISSFDSDFFQLITPNVTVFRYRGDNSVLCDGEYVRAKFGIEPFQYADFKSLVGDTADNIKGAYKVGPKTASGLLKEFGTLQNLLQNAESIRKERVRNSIIEGKERLKTNEKLIRLDGCAELPFAVEKLAYRYTGVTTNEVLSAIGLR
ncbi:MAG: flap endonuclease [Clostridia bacterium]|nr:flap endonuclease [Clostridia bacterium]